MSGAEEQTRSTGMVNADTKRIDQLKELYRSVPMKLDFERMRIMKEVYEDTVGYLLIELARNERERAQGRSC